MIRIQTGEKEQEDNDDLDEDLEDEDLVIVLQNGERVQMDDPFKLIRTEKCQKKRETDVLHNAFKAEGSVFLLSFFFLIYILSSFLFLSEKLLLCVCQFASVELQLTKPCVRTTMNVK